MRHHLYRNIHKGIRALISDFVHKSGRVDFTDAAAVAKFRSELKVSFELLEAHARNENNFIAPLLAACDPALNEEMESTHEEQERRLSSLLARLDAIDSRRPEARAEGHELVVDISRMAGEFYVHMADEETQIMPALWKAYDDAALIEAEGRLLASLPPDELAHDAHWMLPAMTDAERLEMLSRVRATAPEPAWQFLRGLARTVLSPEDDARLEAGLAETAKRVA